MPAIMKLTDVGSGKSEVEPYLADSAFILQQKFDGTRIQAQWDPARGSIFFSNNGIDPVGHSAAKLKLPALEAELLPILQGLSVPVTLEGELLIRTGEFPVWDLLIGDDPNGWHTTGCRIRLLEDLLGNRSQELVTVSPTAWTEPEKREMWERICSAGVEGAVSKWADSRYLPGVRTNQWLKHKLVKTADLVVIKAERTFKPGGTVVHKGSAQLGYVDARFPYAGPQPIASASLIGKDLTIDVGDVVEVAFLYREPGGGLVQPRILRKRWDDKTENGDKRPGECTEDQFADYSRAVVR
jgi:hypothetical protein